MAGEDKLSPSGLEKITYKQPGWNHVMNRDFGIINYRLQKVGRLLDVDLAVPPVNGSVLGWNATASKWQPMSPLATTTTTTVI